MENSSNKTSPDILNINLSTPKIESTNKPNLSLSDDDLVEEENRRNSVFIPHPQIVFEEKEDIVKSLFIKFK